MRLLRRLFFWICWPGLYVYFFRSQRSRVLLVRDDQLLLVKGFWKSWFGDDRWGLPGGGINNGEQSTEGASRELSEELGMNVVPTDLELIGQQGVREYGIRYEAHFFRLPASSGLDITPRKPEIVEIAWVSSQAVTAGNRFKPEVLQALALLAKR